MAIDHDLQSPGQHAACTQGHPSATSTCTTTGTTGCQLPTSSSSSLISFSCTTATASSTTTTIHRLTPLTFAWDQTDQWVKIYIDLAQILHEPAHNSDEDGDAVGKDRSSIIKPEAPEEFQFSCPDEWTAYLVINRKYACRLSDLCHRIIPEESKMKKGTKRVTLSLRKKEKENHWFNLHQKRTK
ncbi:unnamed protein product [Amoebophrya sp. A25]|nr:unnamed protein product [Amoebophrya sp. A25]|eukprot:GSA25T00003734001.1